MRKYEFYNTMCAISYGNGFVLVHYNILYNSGGDLDSPVYTDAVFGGAMREKIEGGLLVMAWIIYAFIWLGTILAVLIKRDEAG